MDESPPPRKQLRLLVKGREKMSELLGKRRQEKTQKENSTFHRDEDSDVEDDVPILSKITDPASRGHEIQQSSKNTQCQKGGILPASAALRSTSKGSGILEDIRRAATEAGEEMIKSRRRKDPTCVHESRGLTPVDISYHVSTTQNAVSTQRPLAALEDSKFTFQSVPTAAGKIVNPRSFDSCVDKRNQSNSQPQQVMRSPVPSPQRRLEYFTKELGASRTTRTDLQGSKSSSKVRGRSEVHHDELQPQSIATPTRAANANEAPTTKTVPPKRLFDSFKIGNDSTNRAPRVDRASPITNVSSFIRPQVPVPGLGPEVYRSFVHKSAASRSVLEKSLPDTFESRNFIEDVVSESIHGRKHAYGDTPAPVSDTHLERVPLGARQGDPATRTRKIIFPGEPIMQPTTHPTLDSIKMRESMVVPENFHTEPGRLAKAYLHAVSAEHLKRKRLEGVALPQPFYVHKRTLSTGFNIFNNGFLLHPELCLLLAVQLPVETLISLYSISKDYHIILNQRLTTVILNQATLKAPAASRCYPWRCYAHLCQPDPSYKAGTAPLGTNFRASTTDGTIINIPIPPPPTYEVTNLPGFVPCSQSPLRALPHPAPSKRRVPTFRWLHMALHREKTVHEIYHLFAGRGVPLPGHPSDLSRNSFALSLHKLWFAFDIPDNTRRITYFRSTTLITPYDLANLLTFVVKLDMIFNDPLAGEKRDALRKLVMSSVNGLDTLRRVLKKEIWTDEMEVLRAWTRYGFDLDSEDPNEHARARSGWVPMHLSEEDFAASDNIFGIPRDEVGLLRKEFWGKLDYDEEKRTRTTCAVGRRTHSLMRPDQIVLREAVRRKMTMGKQFLQAMLAGYVDKETLQAVEARDLNGGRGKLLEEEGEYGVDDLVGGVRALDVQEGGDPLLDLGDPWEGSPLTVKHVGARKQQIERSNAEKKRLEQYKREWREDVGREIARKAYRGFTYVDG